LKEVSKLKYTVKTGDTERTYEAQNVEEIKNMIDTIEPCKYSTSDQVGTTPSI
jgi:hypothetical protein